MFDGTAYTSQLLYGLPMPEEYDFTPIEDVMNSAQLLNSIVNYRAAALWGDDDRLLIQDFMFDFFENGSGQELSGLCEGEPLWVGEPCAEPMTLDPFWYDMSWSYTETYDFEEVFTFNRRVGEENPTNMRYWIPLDFSERDILSVLEWNVITGYYYDDGSVAWRSYILPRYNQYQYAERNSVYGEHSEETIAWGSLSHEKNTTLNMGYLIVNPQHTERFTSQ